MMRTIRQWAAAIAILMVLLVLASDAMAQRRGFRRGRGFASNSMMALFRISKVQGEIDLSLGQAELIFALQSDLSNEYRNARQDRSPDNGLPTAEQVSKASDEVAKKILSAVLRPEQYARLHELYLQRLGLRAIDTDPLAEKLGLSPEQRSEAKDILTRLSRNYGRQPISDSDSKIAEEITDLLSDEQKDQWESMLGETFDFR